MRRLVLLAIAAVLAWRILGRRRAGEPEVTVGWADGSSITLDRDAAERDRILAAAETVVGA